MFLSLSPWSEKWLPWTQTLIQTVITNQNKSVAARWPQSAPSRLQQELLHHGCQWEKQGFGMLGRVFFFLFSVQVERSIFNRMGSRHSFYFGRCCFLPQYKCNCQFETNCYYIVQYVFLKQVTLENEALCLNGHHSSNKCSPE